MKCCDCEFNFLCKENESYINVLGRCEKRDFLLYEKYRAKSKTRADKIRSMSNKVMAKELIDMVMELCEDGVPSEDYVLDWLERPVEEE